KIQTLDTSNVPETSQVTGSENVFRDDEVDAGRILTQEEALSNAKRTHNGFFVVKSVFE
ncbi:Asp-tRNA(Asn)/Glu-tRNA(Gln) amidotransferase GatCAB subunit C, partial [Candidatus Gottesmanbacteria bacterium]|nr:Asp-tRNA(Asn)/Glu-tRNA(Gln) amidotransferase GatCAB subunit C [Candidatus Gottesmanbacteria bacterium]